MLDTISMADQLTGNYKTVFEKADMYCLIEAGSTEEAEEKIMNLYDLLLQAQEENKPVEKIIGNNLEAFCKEYFAPIEEAKKKWYVFLTEGLYRIFKIIFIWSIIWIFPFEGPHFGLDTKQNISIYILGIILGLGVLFFSSYFFKPLIFKSKKIKPVFLSFLILILFAGGVILMTFVSDYIIFEVKTSFLIVLSLSYVLIYLFLRSLYRYHKFGTIRKDSKEVIKSKKELKKQMKFFNKEVSHASMKKTIAKALAKRFETLQKKKQLTFSEFADKIRREQKQSKIVDLLLLLFFIAIILAPTIMEIIHSNLLEGLIFGTILTAVEVPIYLFFTKTTDKNYDYMVEILESCEKENIDLLEYQKFIQES